jgi:hypothetical protein
LGALPPRCSLVRLASHSTAAMPLGADMVTLQHSVSGLFLMRVSVTP